MRTSAIIVVACGLMSGCNFGVRGVDVNTNPAPGEPGVPTPIDPATVSPVDDGGVITPPSPPPPPNYGGACDPNKNECSPGLTCERDGRSGPGPSEDSRFPGGYCTSDCETNPCPSGTQCGSVGDSTKVCLVNCPATGCRDGYVCCTRNFNPGVCTTSNVCDRD